VAKTSWTPIWLQSTFLSALVLLILSLLSTVFDPIRAGFLLMGTLSQFLHWSPVFFIMGFTLTFILRFERVFSGASESPLEGGSFISRLIILAGLSAVWIALSVFLFEPSINSSLDQAIESRALSVRIARQAARYEESLTQETADEHREGGSILSGVRKDITRRIQILSQLENLYTIQARLVPEKDGLVDRMDSIRAQLEEQEKNLRRLPIIQKERQLLWSDFNNLTGNSALLFAWELFRRRQWPECYQIASLALLLKESSGESEKLMERSREELLKIPIIDGSFFQRKSRFISLYQAGLYREAYYGLVEMEGEGLVDEEVLRYLQLSKEQIQGSYTFIETAKLGLDVPILKPVFWTQDSITIPGAREWLSASWLSLSRMGYLLKSPYILRRGPNGTWTSWTADYARIANDPTRPGQMLLDFRFIHERLNLTQEGFTTLPSPTLPLQMDKMTAGFLTDSRIRPESLSFFNLFPLADSAHKIGSSRSSFTAEIQMRIWAVPAFFLGVFILVFLSFYLRAREGGVFGGPFIAAGVLGAGFFFGYDTFHWLARVLLGGLSYAIGLTASLVVMGVAFAFALTMMGIFLTNSIRSYSSGTR